MTSSPSPQLPSQRPALLQRLVDHFGAEPAKLPVIEQGFEIHERPNLHLALSELLGAADRETEVLGILAIEEYRPPTLARLTRDSTALGYEEGPVEYVDVALPNDRQLSCIKQALHLFRFDGFPIALLIRIPMHSHPPTIAVEVMGRDREAAEGFLRQLTKAARFGQAYRGHVLSLEFDCYRSLRVQFQNLPRLSRSEIILPDALLARIERHTLSFSRHADKLLAAKRHLKRGILLHGSPGVGKTLCAMYLAAQMEGRTVILLTVAGIQAIESACKLARLLAPTTVILEDVDLIGTEREHQTVGANALLFELLNQMDGLAEDVDLLFILTTNRPDVLEPALCARPGRIDQAIEIPLPDADCRRRLFQLYGKGVELELTPEEFDAVVTETKGASGAFIRELIRRATVLAVEDNPQATPVLNARRFNEAMAELLIAGGALTQRLLGASMKTDEDE